MWKLVDPSCYLNYCTTPSSISLSDANWTLSLMVQQWQNDMVISTDVWAPPFARHSVAVALYGPHWNGQQHDAINQSPYRVHNQPNAMKWKVLKYQTYSSNLSLCVFHMFGLWKKACMMDDAVDQAVTQCSRQQLKDFSTDKICSTCASKQLRSEWLRWLS